MQNNTLKMYVDQTLDSQRKQTLDELKSFLKTFPIHGGTGLALYLGHRRSYDFDLFSPNPISRNLNKQVRDKMQIKQILFDTTDEFTFINEKEVKITFLYYPYKSLEENHEENGIYVGSLNDLIANKFFVIGRRAEIRDYIDIYTILQKYSLDYCINLTLKKFGNLTTEKIILGQVAYLSGLNFQDQVFKDMNIKKKKFTDFLKNIAHSFIF